MRWSALLDVLRELGAISQDEGADNEDGKVDGQLADVERAPLRKWLSRCD